MLSGLPAVGLERPWLLLLLGLPLLIRHWRRRSHHRLQQYAEPALWQFLLPAKQLAAATVRGLWPAAWSLLVLAAASPYITTDPGNRPSLDIALIVDVSPSMSSLDVTPSRLDNALTRVRHWLPSQQGHRIGLIAYSANAYQILPPTSDLDAVDHFVAALNTDLTRLQGSNLSAALELAARQLSHGPTNNRAAILISDGDLHDHDEALSAARHLTLQHVRLYTLGVGTSGGALVRDSTGRIVTEQDHPVVSRLQAPVLATLATLTGGRYLPLSDPGSMSTLSAQLRQLSHDQRSADTQHHHALFQWPLALAMVLLVIDQIIAPRRLTTALLAGWLLLSILVLPGHVRAGMVDEQRAHQALMRADYPLAQRLYRDSNTYNGQLGYGVASYRRGDYPRAQQAFLRARQLAQTAQQRASACFNLGNTLFELDDTAQAIHWYQQALTLDRWHKKAAYNLQQIRRRQQLQTQDAAMAAARSHQGNGPQPADDAADTSIDGQRSSPPITRRQATDTLLTSHPSDPARTLPDDARQVLRQRFAAQDSRYPARRELRPW